jgi:hypothetical protein
VFAGIIFWRSEVSGGLWQSLTVSGKPQLTVEADGPRMDSFVPMGPSQMAPLPSIAGFAADGAKLDRASPASTQGCGPGSAWHAVMMPIRNFSPSPSHPPSHPPSPPPSLRPAGIPIGHGGYAPGCCVCGACKSRPTGLLRRDTLDISNPSRLRKIPPATQKLSTRI